MKNKLRNLLLIFFFILGNQSIGHAGISEKGVGAEAVILNVKTGAVYSSPIPSEYVSDDGELLVPLEVTLVQDDKLPAFTTYSGSSNVELPANLSGAYVLTVSIGNFNSTQKIVL